MTLYMQLLWGSVYLCLCCGLHMVILSLLAPLLTRTGEIVENWPVLPRNVTILWVCLAGILLSHTAQIWFWSAALHNNQQFEDMSTALYFALVSYTTLGYGDVTLGAASRIFGAFSAITGVLAFGISTAFLVGVMHRILGGLGLEEES